MGCYLIGFRICQTWEIEPKPPITTLPPTVEGRGQLELLEGEKINLNTASKDELMRLSGIGEVLAERIIALRQSLGTFRSLEEIKTVEGIGDKVFESMKDYITLE